jgi:hypothetical protein
MTWFKAFPGVSWIDQTLYRDSRGLADKLREAFGLE